MYVTLTLKEIKNIIKSKSSSTLSSIIMVNLRIYFIAKDKLIQLDRSSLGLYVV